MKKRRILSISILLLIYFLSAAQAQVGLNKIAQSTMNFQLVSVSPRASAMGEAFYAVGSGSESIFFNPAGIVEMDHRFDMKFYMTKWIADINYFAGAVTWTMGSIGCLGISALAVDYGTIHATSLLAPGESNLYPLGYKDNGTIDNVGAYSFGLTYGKDITTQFFIGGNVRLVGQNLGHSVVTSGSVDNSIKKLAFDAGVKYYTGFRSFRFGMAIRNFSSTVKREEIEEQLPLIFIMGMAMDLFDVFNPGHSPDNMLTLAIDFQHPNNYSERMNLGIEYLIMRLFSVRLGYQVNQDITSWSAGMGLRTNLGAHAVTIDYSYSNVDIFTGVSRLSVGMSF